MITPYRSCKLAQIDVKTFLDISLSNCIKHQHMCVLMPVVFIVRAATSLIFTLFSLVFNQIVIINLIDCFSINVKKIINREYVAKKPKKLIFCIRVNGAKICNIIIFSTFYMKYKKFQLCFNRLYKPDLWINFALSKRMLNLKVECYDIVLLYSIQLH